MFESTIAGIPCQIEIENFQPIIPAKLSGPPEDCYPEEGGEVEYSVLDRRGYPAPWLERKLTRADEQRIEQECWEVINAGD